MTIPQAQYVETEEALNALGARLQRASVVAVDTESDSFHSYREKVCLLQMTVDDEDVIIDPLRLPSLEPLRPVLEDPTIVKVFHDACYDLACLHRDHGFSLRGLFDTMLASRLLGWRRFGLAAILEERYAFEADKRLQRSDWSKRPLSAAQMRYAQFDTHFLPRLHVSLRQELERAGRLHWAEEDFQRLPATCERLGTRRPVPDPEGFWRIKGTRTLSAVALGRIKQLYLARDRIAERLDWPAFKVVNDATLMELAKHPPHSYDAMRPVRGLSRHGIRRFGHELFTALRDAKPHVGDPPQGGARKRRGPRLADAAMKQRYEALREVRRHCADALGIEPEVGLANAFLEELARHPPGSLADLCALDELRGWRRPHFAAALWASLRS